jgi:predicted dehydrogenase
VERLRAEVRSPYLIEARRLTPNGRIRDVGVVLDLMIHDIDIVLGLVREPVVDVAVAGHTFGDGPHEDVCAAQVRFEGGCVARFLASRVAPDAERSLVVAEAHRTFRLDFAKEPHTEMAIFRPASPHTDANGEAAGTHVLVDRQVIYEDNPLRKELVHFVSRVRGTTAPIGTLADDIRSLSLARTCSNGSARTGSPPPCRTKTGGRLEPMVDVQQILPHRYPFLLVDAFVRRTATRSSA